ncbi:MAG: helix-turn-helix transcriptional regulator, partial [Thermoplasmata archaeon]|nr:helix-turn-helix transcriptional regulator [Thermoplasmata archaeon]
GGGGTNSGGYPAYALWGIAALLGAGSGALVLWSGLRWQARRAAEAGPDPPTTGPPVDPPSSLAPSGTGSAAPPPIAAAPAVARPTVAQRRLTQEVLLHLYSLGRWGPDELSPPEATQAGIGTGISAAQNALSNVLRRLEAAGFLQSELTHVSGGSRRVKAYRLTARGEALARSLRPTARREPSLSEPSIPRELV